MHVVVLTPTGVGIDVGASVGDVGALVGLRVGDFVGVLDG